MTADPGTMALYGRIAEEYALGTAKDAPDDDLRAFMALVRPRGRILDWGCGVGTAATFMTMEQFAVRAVDPCPEMREIAAQVGIDALDEDFDALDEVDAYDGVWANFSLMHAPREALARHLAAAARALRPGGALHLGMPTVVTGVPEDGRDPLTGCYVFGLPAEETTALAEAAGFELVSVREAPNTDPFGREGGMSLHLFRLGAPCPS